MDWQVPAVAVLVNSVVESLAVDAVLLRAANAEIAAVAYCLPLVVASVGSFAPTLLRPFQRFLRLLLLLPSLLLAKTPLWSVWASPSPTLFPEA